MCADGSALAQLDMVAETHAAHGSKVLTKLTACTNHKYKLQWPQANINFNFLILNRLIRAAPKQPHRRSRSDKQDVE